MSETRSDIWRQTAQRIRELKVPYRLRGLPPTLTAAAMAGDIESMRLFLAQGASIEEKTPVYSSPLHAALAADQAEAASFLRARGASLARGEETAARRPTSPFRAASEARAAAREARRRAKRREAIPEILATIRSGALDDEIDALDQWDGSLLALALENELTEVADLLLARGADPNAAGPEGTPALYFAAGLRDHARVTALLAAGADPDGRGSVGAHCTALMEAAKLGDLELVETLLAAGADPMLEGDGGQTAANEAQGPYRVAILRRLGEAARRCGAVLPKALGTRGRRTVRGVAERRGVHDFLRHLETGEPDWTVLAARAPIARASAALAQIRQAEVDEDVARRSLAPKDHESFALQLVGHPWTLEYRTLFWIRGADFDSLLHDARALSEQLAIETLAFSGADVSGTVEVTRFRAGARIEAVVWQDGEPTTFDSRERARPPDLETGPDAIDRYFTDLDLYVPPATFEDDGLATRLVIGGLGPKAVARLDRLARRG